MSDPLQASKTRRAFWPRDLLASIVVFLVALPLCMGIALASGAPVAAGLVTGIVGGLIVGCISGAPLQVSGPAAGLTVVCGDIIHEHGLPALGVIVMLAGAMQFAAGILKIGQWFRAVSPAVIHGMLSGIGVLIVASQLHVMVDDRPRQGGLANLLSIPEALRKGLPLPVWEPADLRQQRTQALQQVGDLHERQSEIEAHFAREAALRSKADQGGGEDPVLLNLADLQATLSSDVQAARQQILASPVARAPGERTARLLAALDKARLCVEAASADLAADRQESAIQSLPQASAALVAVLSNLKSHDWAAKIGLLSIGIIVFWTSLLPKAVQIIPAPLVAVAAATAATYFLSLPVLYVEVPANLIDGLTFPALHVFQNIPARELLVAAIMMAMNASAGTLLCASAVDRMHHGPRTQYDRELAAQGIGNLLCGLVGALPMSGVIVRSAANVQAGGRSRLSAILHGLWLLLFVVALGSVLRLIPTAALAGILVYTGCKLIDFKHFRWLCQNNSSEAAIFLATVVVIVTVDLLAGVVTGVVLSAAKLLLKFSRLEVSLLPASRSRGRNLTTLRLSGAATFLRLPVLAAELENAPQGSPCQIDIEQLDYIDDACLELLKNWAQQHEATGGEVIVDWVRIHACFEKRVQPADSALDEPVVMHLP